MTNKLMVGVAISALMIGGALAQSPTTPGSSDQTRPPAAAPANPSTQAPAEKMDKQPAAKSEDRLDAGNKAAGGEPKIVASQSPDQFLSSSFSGTDVIGSDGKKIGDVSDILFEKDGTIKAYIVSFGGFLGMGDKEIAIAPESFEVIPAEPGGSKKLKLAMDQNQIKQAQTFTAYQPPRPATTTGAGGGLGRSPAGGGMTPRGQ